VAASSEAARAITSEPMTAPSSVADCPGTVLAVPVGERTTQENLLGIYLRDRRTKLDPARRRHGESGYAGG
jgi:hypothetical protein